MPYTRDNIKDLISGMSDDVLDFIANIGNNYVYTVYSMVKKLRSKESDADKLLTVIEKITINGPLQKLLIKDIGGAEFADDYILDINYTEDYAPNLEQWARIGLSLSASDVMVEFCPGLPQEKITMENIVSHIREHDELFYLYEKISQK